MHEKDTPQGCFIPKRDGGLVFDAVGIQKAFIADPDGNINFEPVAQLPGEQNEAEYYTSTFLGEK